MILSESTPCIPDAHIRETRPHRWHANCRDIWPDDPAQWCPVCECEAAMDFPRLATLAERLVAAREAWDLWREQEAARCPR